MDRRPLAARIRWGNIARLGFVVAAAGVLMWATAGHDRPARLPPDVGVMRAPRPLSPRPQRMLPSRPPPRRDADRPHPRRRRSHRRRRRQRAAADQAQRAPDTVAPPVHAAGRDAPPSPEFGP